MPEEKEVLGAMRFGRFELSADTGELRKDGIRLKLAGQAIQVLAMLAATPGKLVAREELQQKLWPGASFGDPEHGLNAAVNKLRETLGDSATEPKYIETVPGRGYRFIALLDSPVVAPEPEPPDPQPEPEAPRPEPKPRKPVWWKRRAVIAVAACIAVTGSLSLWLVPQMDRVWRLYELQQLTVVPLTTLPGVVWSPTFSPDGSQIAFLWVNGNANSADLYVKVIGNDIPLRLTHEAFGLDAAAWSPDGKNIAICRETEEGPKVFLISPLGGPERQISSEACGTRYGSLFSWSQDGKQLAFPYHPANSTSFDTFHLFVLSLDTLQGTPVKMNCDAVYTPAFSPRGDYLAWACADNMSDASIYIQRLTDGSVTRILHGVDGIGGLAWSGDQRHIVFSTSYTGGDLWDVALDRPNHAERLPFGHDVTDVAVSPAGKRLAFTQNHLNTNIWRVDLSQSQAKAQKVIASSREQTAPDYSPDGAQVTFESTRSGNNEIWVSDSDGSNAVQFSSFGIKQTGSPHWSPDGKLIAFDSRAGGEANIYLVDPHGGVPRKLDIDVRGNNFPTWSHDGKWIYFVNGSDAHTPTVWKVPSQGGHAVQISKRKALFPRESPDGHYVYVSRDFQLWRVKTDGTEEQQIQGMSGLCSIGEAWSPFGSGIYFLACPNNYREIDFFDLNTKETSRTFLPERSPASDWWMGGLPVSKDGKWLLYSQMDEQSADIMLVENWH